MDIQIINLWLAKYKHIEARKHYTGTFSLCAHDHSLMPAWMSGSGSSILEAMVDAFKKLEPYEQKSIEKELANLRQVDV